MSDARLTTGRATGFLINDLLSRGAFDTMINAGDAPSAARACTRVCVRRVIFTVDFEFATGLCRGNRVGLDGIAWEIGTSNLSEFANE